MAVGKKLRFEVFKRDNFKCQYCGRSAPDVILNADHIRPVADGGGDELLNLITSCWDCNSGKGARLLSDQSMLDKQRDQLEELNARREQIEMMIQWKEELANLDKSVVQRIGDYWTELTGGFSLTATGMQDVKKLLRKFSYSEIHDGMATAADQYLIFHGDKATKDSVEYAFKKIGGICHTERLAEEKPYIHDLYYVRAVMRNKGYVNERLIFQLLEEAARLKVNWESVKQFAKNCRSWTQFRDGMEEFIARQKKQPTEASDQDDDSNE